MTAKILDERRFQMIFKHGAMYFYALQSKVVSTFA